MSAPRRAPAAAVVGAGVAAVELAITGGTAADAVTAGGVPDAVGAIGAVPTARFVTVECADDYYESLDMATAMHPQSLLCYEMYGQPLTREHGAPLRLSIPTKIGYKQAKYLTDLKVSHVLEKVGYWEDQGYSEFYGL